jgi:hypothetical protein
MGKWDLELWIMAEEQDLLCDLTRRAGVVN